MRVNNTSNGNDDQTSSQQPIVASRAPYCNISDAQFSFHGHRDSVRFFLNVPNLTIQKSTISPATATVASSVATASTASKAASSYEKAETLLVVSGGHGYIDFRIGDTTTIGSSSSSKKAGIGGVIDSDDIKADVNTSADESGLLKKSDRAYLIVWQINNE